MPTSSQYQPNDAYDLVATIPSGQTTSNAIDLSGTDVCGFFLPAAFTGTALKLLAAPSPTATYVAVQDGTGSDLSLPASASKYVPITALAIVAGVRFVKVVSDATEAAARPITLATRSI